MNVWLIGAKTVAFITVAACIVGLAASITTLVGCVGPNDVQAYTNA